ncbi:integrator complex subunit 13 isoform X1 [Xenopus laevis]|uniref:Integrator complex subunit 13 isoform X1 n=1 Tax=Xenopus laevis TaxID=8355 RepID=A0A8J1MJQ7_XENLA|nr:integrator complex subunit 13 isoform X1 [Xenopus laevis]
MKGRNVQFMGERGAAGPLTGNKMTTFSESHKTVFVVDHCPYMSESVGSTWSLICSLRTALRIIPLAPISKSLYTCAIEASLEYSRIMYNIFPFRKLVSDSGSRSLNSWNQEDQNVQEVSDFIQNSVLLRQVVLLLWGRSCPASASFVPGNASHIGFIFPL